MIYPIKKKSIGLVHSLETPRLNGQLRGTILQNRMKKLTPYFLAIIISILPAGSVLADTIIFTEGCTSAVGSSLATSTTISPGTSWSTQITLAGSPTTLNYITAGNTLCSTQAAAANIGYGYTMTPNSSTNEYKVDFSWIDGGTIGADEGEGVLLNYIDSNNYYACLLNDDATMDAKIMKVTGGVGSTLVSAPSLAVGTASIIKCQIDYTGSKPVLSLMDDTVILLASTTDSTNPLTRTNKAGFFCGATPAGTADDCGAAVDGDTIRLTEVTVSGSPVVTTSAATGVVVDSAELNGTVTWSKSAAATDSGFAWGTVSTLSGGDTATTTGAGTPGTGDSFSKIVRTLKAGKQYFFRAYATNSSGTGYGTILNFTTGTDTTASRRMRLFEGFRIKIIEGTLKLYQQ